MSSDGQWPVGVVCALVGALLVAHHGAKQGELPAEVRANFSARTPVYYNGVFYPVGTSRACVGPVVNGQSEKWRPALDVPMWVSLACADKGMRLTTVADIKFALSVKSAMSADSDPIGLILIGMFVVVVCVGFACVCRPAKGEVSPATEPLISESDQPTIDDSSSDDDDVPNPPPGAHDASLHVVPTVAGDDPAPKDGPPRPSADTLGEDTASDATLSGQSGVASTGEARRDETEPRSD